MGHDHERVRVYDDDRARINDLRQGDDTQADVVARALDALEGETDREGLSRDAEVRAQLNRIESAASTAEERTGRIEGTLEDMGAGR